MDLKVKRLVDNAILPTKNHQNDAGIDLYSLEDVKLRIGKPTKIRTGIAIEIPEFYMGLICDRSSMGASGIKVFGGVVDSGYRGEIQVVLQNLDLFDFFFYRRSFEDTLAYQQIKAGDKIAQLVIMLQVLSGYVFGHWNVKEVTNLSDSGRGEKGFGSSGV